MDKKFALYFEGQHCVTTTSESEISKRIEMNCSRYPDSVKRENYKVFELVPVKFVTKTVTVLERISD